MRKLLALSLAAAAACGGGSFKDQAREALPDSGGVKMGPQQAQMQSQPGTTQQNATQLSGWYLVTVAYSVAINAGTAWTLGVVEAVIESEPKSCTADSCTWGPGSNALDPNTYQLTVTRNANGSFDWKLEGQSKAAPPGAPFSKIIYGNAVPSGQRHRGSGTFTVDLNAAAQLSGHSSDQGTIAIEYSNVGPAHVVAHFNGVKDQNNPTQLGNAYYNYQADITGGGDMEIAWHNLSTTERDDIHSRWKADGSGRADVTVQQPAATATFSECWSTAATGFNVVFSATVGSESACSFAPAAPGSHINDAE